MLIEARSNCCDAIVQSQGEQTLQVDNTAEDYICSECGEPCGIYDVNDIIT